MFNHAMFVLTKWKCIDWNGSIVKLISLKLSFCDLYDLEMWKVILLLQQNFITPLFTQNIANDGYMFYTTFEQSKMNILEH